jgi:hypothetical protein
MPRESRVRWTMAGFLAGTGPIRLLDLRESVRCGSYDLLVVYASGMKRRLSSLFRIFTILLLMVSIATAYMNVFSDDADVRARANELARKQAGCGDKCKVTNIQGNRGMFEERLEYDVEGAGAGHYVVVCRRAYVAFGDYACTVAKQ